MMYLRMPFAVRRPYYSIGHSHRYHNIRLSSSRMDFIKYGKLFIYNGNVHLCYNDLYLLGINTRKHIRYNIEFIVVTGIVIVQVSAAHVNIFSTAPLPLSNKYIHVCNALYLRSCIYIIV